MTAQLHRTPAHSFSCLFDSLSWYPPLTPFGHTKPSCSSKNLSSHSLTSGYLHLVFLLSPRNLFNSLSPLPPDFSQMSSHEFLVDPLLFKLHLSNATLLLPSLISLPFSVALMTIWDTVASDYLLFPDWNISFMRSKSFVYSVHWCAVSLEQWLACHRLLLAICWINDWRTPWDSNSSYHQVTHKDSEAQGG